VQDYARPRPARRDHEVRRGSTLEVIKVAKLVDSIPVTARKELETYLNEDLVAQS